MNLSSILACFINKAMVKNIGSVCLKCLFPLVDRFFFLIVNTHLNGNVLQFRLRGRSYLSQKERKLLTDGLFEDSCLDVPVWLLFLMLG